MNELIEFLTADPFVSNAEARQHRDWLETVRRNENAAEFPPRRFAMPSPIRHGPTDRAEVVPTSSS